MKIYKIVLLMIMGCSTMLHPATQQDLRDFKFALEAWKPAKDDPTLISNMLTPYRKLKNETRFTNLLTNAQEYARAQGVLDEIESLYAGAPARRYPAPAAPAAPIAPVVPPAPIVAPVAPVVPAAPIIPVAPAPPAGGFAPRPTPALSSSELERRRAELASRAPEVPTAPPLGPVTFAATPVRIRLNSNLDNLKREILSDIDNLRTITNTNQLQAQYENVRDKFNAAKSRLGSPQNRVWARGIAAQLEDVRRRLGSALDMQEKAYETIQSGLQAFAEAGVPPSDALVKEIEDFLTIVPADHPMHKELSAILQAERDAKAKGEAKVIIYHPGGFAFEVPASEGGIVIGAGAPPAPSMGYDARTKDQIDFIWGRVAMANDLISTAKSSRDSNYGYAEIAVEEAEKVLNQISDRLKSEDKAAIGRTLRELKTKIANKGEKPAESIFAIASKYPDFSSDIQEIGKDISAATVAVGSKSWNKPEIRSNVINNIQRIQKRFTSLSSALRQIDRDKLQQKIDDLAQVVAAKLFNEIQPISQLLQTGKASDKGKEDFKLLYYDIKSLMDSGVKLDNWQNQFNNITKQYGALTAPAIPTAPPLAPIAPIPTAPTGPATPTSFAAQLTNFEQVRDAIDEFQAKTHFEEEIPDDLKAAGMKVFAALPDGSPEKKQLRTLLGLS